jgi:hypothetical protein
VLESRQVTPEEKLAFLIGLSELPYELMTQLTHRGARSHHAKFKTALRGLCKEFVAKNMWSDDGFDLSPLQKVSVKEWPMFARYSFNWPSVDWREKTGGLNTMIEYLRDYELDAVWNLSNAPPPKWKAWVDSIIESMTFDADEDDESDADDEADADNESDLDA